MSVAAELREEMRRLRTEEETADLAFKRAQVTATELKGRLQRARVLRLEVYAAYNAAITADVMARSRGDAG